MNFLNKKSMINFFLIIYAVSTDLKSKY